MLRSTTKDFMYTRSLNERGEGSSSKEIVDKQSLLESMRESCFQCISDSTDIPFSDLRANYFTNGVLDLSNKNIESLPETISSLVQLRQLLLRDVDLLMELPSEIRALKNLEVLDAQGTQLICLPKEIGELLQLECLKVSFYRHADRYIKNRNETIIPRGELSKLKHLVELSIDVDPDCTWWDAEAEAIIEELPMLSGSLKVLKLFIPTEDLLEQFLDVAWSLYISLSDFRLIVGRHESDIVFVLPSDLKDKFEKLKKCFKYVNGEGNTDTIGDALELAEALLLDRHWTIKKLSEFMIHHMLFLVFCLVVECNEMNTIIDGSDIIRPALETLQYLSVHHMKNLQCIWKGPTVAGCLSNLQILVLYTCPELITVFNEALLVNLKNLKEVIVKYCPKIKSLVTVEESHSHFLQNNHDFLPRLQNVLLVHLPQLLRISSDGLLIGGQKLQKIVVYNCPKLEKLSALDPPVDNVYSKYIQEINDESQWLEELKSARNETEYLHHLFLNLIDQQKDSETAVHFDYKETEVPLDYEETEVGSFSFEKEAYRETEVDLIDQQKDSETQVHFDYEETEVPLDYEETEVGSFSFEKEAYRETEVDKFSFETEACSEIEVDQTSPQMLDYQKTQEMVVESIFGHSEMILERLISLSILENRLFWGLKAELGKLALTVSSIKSILLDVADQKKLSLEVQDRLQHLEHVMSQVDGLLHHLIEEVRPLVVAEGSMMKAIRISSSTLNLFHTQFKMCHAFQEIRSRLEVISADGKRFQFVERVSDIPVAHPRKEQTHYREKLQVVGRDIDKNRIVELLLSSSTLFKGSKRKAVSVLPIVGVGGIGKTTLAKLVYDDEAIVSNFDIRLWICVSEGFDLKKLLERIMKDATGGVDHAHLDLRELQACISSTLEMTKFLLVLDDVWDEDPEKWEALKNLLKCRSNGSKVVVTTRSETTAEIMGTLGFYKLKFLPDKECFTIFVKCAFKEGEEKHYLNLLEIGKEIVSTCIGLPLAVKCLGGLLYSRRKEQEWQYIMRALLSSRKRNTVSTILKLSYDDMAYHLKQCFAYCSRLPRGVEISNFSLISEWIAHGFIQSSSGGSNQLEDIGNQYFLELLSRSLFENVPLEFNNLVCRVKMHDLVHDFAMSVAGKEVSHFKNDMQIVYEPLDIYYYFLLQS